MAETLSLQVNGEVHEVVVASDTPLLQVLRNDLGLTAAKLGCALEQCMACAVLVDGEPTASCVSPVGLFVGREITTLEGIGTPERPHPLQLAFLEEHAAQCGYCIPGIIVSATALLERNPHPTRAEICEALDPHLCRCGTHPRIIAAVQRAAAGIAS